MIRFGPDSVGRNITIAFQARSLAGIGGSVALVCDRSWQVVEVPSTGEPVTFEGVVVPTRHDSIDVVVDGPLFLDYLKFSS